MKSEGGNWFVSALFIRAASSAAAAATISMELWRTRQIHWPLIIEVTAWLHGKAWATKLNMHRVITPPLGCNTNGNGSYILLKKKKKKKRNVVVDFVEQIQTQNCGAPSTLANPPCVCREYTHHSSLPGLFVRCGVACQPPHVRLNKSQSRC